MRRYRVHSEIGKGGFGRVFRVREEGLAIAPDLALKLLHAGSADDEAVCRLRDEARMLVALRHPNVVRLYRFVELHTGPALLLELVNGANLSDLLQFGPVPPRAALDLVATVAEALRYAWHCPGEDGQPLRLLHRDVKPGNIALSAEAEVKLLDFGIALADLSAREAKTGPEPRGTPTYMAPERRLLVDTPTVDVFGLGLVLFNLLTCEPHPELPESPERWEGFQAALAEALARKLEMDCPQREAITMLIREAVAWRPEDRPLPAAFGVRASVLARAMAGPGLKGWASQVVPRVLALAPSAAPVVGEVLEEVEEEARETTTDAAVERGAARTWGSAKDGTNAARSRGQESRGGRAGAARAAEGVGRPEPAPGPTGGAACGSRELANDAPARDELARDKATPEATRMLLPPKQAPPPGHRHASVVASLCLLLTLGVGAWRWGGGPDSSPHGPTDVARAETPGASTALTGLVGEKAFQDSTVATARELGGPRDEAGSNGASSPETATPRRGGAVGAQPAPALVSVRSTVDLDLDVTTAWASGTATVPGTAGDPTPLAEARVSLVGNASWVELVSPNGAVRLPASVPPGAYTLRVDFLYADRPFSYGVVQLAPGGHYEVACDGSVLVCRTREVR